MKRKNDSTLKTIIKEITKLAKLEFNTAAGIYNLVFSLALIIFIAIYSSSSAICHAISSAADCVKTYFLGKDIYHPYDAPNPIKVCSPIICIFIFCFGYLIIHEYRKTKIKK